MPRYIDADALIVTLENVCSASNNVKQRRIEDLVLHGIVPQIIDDAPTADVQPVKHGRWKLITQNKFTGTKTLRCTYCKNYFVVRDDTLNAGRGDANFCPNCGSKNRMDGDSDDEP